MSSDPLWVSADLCVQLAVLLPVVFAFGAALEWHRVA
jgi:hypothetical protein